MSFLENHLQVLESSVLPEFQLIMYGEPIFTFKDVDLTLVPHMRVPWGTNRWDVFNPQGGPSTLLVRLKLHRFVSILK